MMTVDLKLKEMLLPVLGLDSIDEIEIHQALVNDLGADSLDFVEIVFLIEKTFGVKIETSELVSGGTTYSDIQIFSEGKLTAEGLKVIQESLATTGERFAVGMSKIDIFSLITVQDMATIIQSRMVADA